MYSEQHEMKTHDKRNDAQIYYEKKEKVLARMLMICYILATMIHSYIYSLGMNDTGLVLSF